MRFVALTDSLRDCGGRKVQIEHLGFGPTYSFSAGWPPRTFGSRITELHLPEARRWAARDGITCLEPEGGPEAFVLGGLLGFSGMQVRFEADSDPLVQDEILLLICPHRRISCHRSESVLEELQSDPAKARWLLI